MTGASLPSIRRGTSALALALAAGLGGASRRAADDRADLEAPDGSATQAPLSPGTAVVYRGDNPLFTIGQPASAGLQRQAEAGDPADLIAAMQGVPGGSAVMMRWSAPAAATRAPTSASTASPARRGFCAARAPRSASPPTTSRA